VAFFAAISDLRRAPDLDCSIGRFARGRGSRHCRHIYTASRSAYDLLAAMNGLVDAAALKVSGLGIEARPPAPMMHHYAAAALGTTHPERMHRRRKPSHGKGSAGTQASAGLAVRTREILHPLHAA
jgi:hypothetical protein